MAYDTLFISADFFGYAGEIAAEMERRGRKVLRFEDRPAVDTITKTLVRIDPRLVARSMKRHFTKILTAAQSNAIRDVLIVKGEAISVAMIRRLRAALPTARFALYFWDSYRNMPRGSSRKVCLFDRAFSFDPADVRADSRLTYRPLFFLPQFTRLPAADRDLDVLFLGTIHSDRYCILKRLRRTLPAARTIEFQMYYPSRRLLAARRLVDPRFWGATESEFIFTPLDRDRVTQLIARAKITVDIERPIQTGLTMRTIEMMGAGRKIVTTNASILTADLYRPNNVAIIDRSSPTISEAFLETPFEPLPDEVLRRYSLAGWVDTVLPDA